MKFDELDLSDGRTKLDLVAGIIQIEKGNYLDFIVDRPEGMKGYMLQLTTFGHGKVFDGKQFFSVKRGQLVLFPPNTLQHYYRQSEYQYWHYKWIYFHPKPRWLKWLNWTNCKENIGRIVINEMLSFQEISQLFSKIAQESESNDLLKKEMNSGLLEYLLMKCVSVENIKDASPIDSRILKVCDLILENLSQNWSVEYFANQVFLSESRLSHLFKQSLGIGLIQWREQQRISEAKKLLYFSSLPVHKIAKSLGYEDSLYFSKIFKKHTALSPSQFRVGELSGEIKM
ncbi:DNA-binding transcriptional regulator AraC [Rodentibacter genomosp. 2]|uniref:arabinose operon transcriptional regulator AraC n=1 Tax=Pasteurellaceae TaxID=712 RepID=UPI00098760BB|nr:arabinose operon transcriptional regulator AraC [Pasteurella sp. 19428wF3_WM03]OOF56557.1 DNA-binding transcriptional regulator AraC [Rodentibacter genomosp. 2]TFU50106.1 arabinose operon transcriptional regulator AraC [Pasteurella sp. WM03]